MPMQERVDKYLDDHMLYLEDNHEKEERMKAFNIIEQMFVQSKDEGLHESEDPQLQTAAQQLRQYFQNPKNTEFFDKSI